MELCIRARRGGKTTEAVKAVREKENAVIIAMSEEDRRRIIQGYRLPESKVVTVDRMKNKCLLGRGDVSIYFDNADSFLSQWCQWHGGTLRWSSFTSDDYDYAEMDRYWRAEKLVNNLKTQQRELRKELRDALILLERPKLRRKIRKPAEIKVKYCFVRLSTIEQLLPSGETVGKAGVWHVW